MMGLLRAEWLKTKRGMLRWLVFLVPLLTGAVLAWYIGGRPWIAPGSTFSGFFSVWAGLVIPLALAIVAGQLVHEEEEAASFGGFLLCARARLTLYLTKFVVLIGASAVATALSAGTFCLGLWLTGYQRTGFGLYAEAAVVCWAAALPLAALSLWIAFAGGMGVSVGVGMGGMLVGALVGGTMVGDKIWPFLPWAWPLRLSGAVAIAQSDVDPAQLEVFMNQVQRACALALIGGTLVMIGSCWWFSHWDGRSASE